MTGNKTTLRALVVLELIHSDEEKEEENNGRRKTRNWIQKSEELGEVCKHCARFTNRRQMRMDFVHFKEKLNLVETDITPQENEKM